jgi:hypothetical protein
MLLNLGADVERLSSGLPLDNHAVVNRRKMLLLKLAIDYRSDNLYDFANFFH